jgi:hypothetical protein
LTLDRDFERNRDGRSRCPNRPRIAFPVVRPPAWKDHNAKLVEAFTPDDAISIADGGVFKGKQQVLKSMTDPRCTVNSFSLSDFSYMWLDKDTVVMTYTGTQDATCDGKKQAGKVLATSIWQKKGGNWVSPFHQETGSM